MKLILKLLIGIILLISIFIFSLRFALVQTYVSGFATDYLSKKLGTVVKIDQLNVEFFKTLVLEGVYIEDLSHDTLLYANKIQVNFNILQFKKKTINIHQISLEKAYFNLKTWADTAGSNYDFLTDFFSPPQTATIDTLPSEWKVNFNSLELINSRFDYDDIGYDSVIYGIDFSHLKVKGINGRFNDIHFDGDTINTLVQDLSFIESSGFEVNKMNGNTQLHSTLLKIDALELVTPLSKLNTDLVFNTTSYRSYNSFIDSVKMKSDFRNTLISLKDIAYFAPELKGLDLKIELSGEVSGTVANLKGRNVDMQLLGETYLKGNFDLRGLPNIEETFIYMKVSELITSRESLEKIPLPPFEDGNTIKLSNEIGRLGDIYFQGSFTGFINDFVAYGEFKTALGQLVTDLSLKNKGPIPFYKGKVEMINFDVGRFFEIQNDVNQVSLVATVEGSGFNAKDLDVDVEGKIKSAGIRNYNYKNIDLKGKLNNQKFEGFAAIKDKNIDFDFNGKIDISGRLPLYNFKANINKAKLSQLKLMSGFDSSMVISTTASLNMIGDKLDNLEGNLQLSNSFYKDSLHTFYIKDITLDALRFSDTLRSISLRSDIADLNLSGNYSFEDLIPSLTNFVIAYIPSARNEFVKETGQEDFTFDLKLKNTKIITDLFLPSLSVSAHSQINGFYNSQEQQVNFDAFFPLIEYQSYKFQNVSILGESPNNELVLNTNINRIQLSEQNEIENVALKLKSARDTLNTFLNWENNNNKGYRASLQLQTAFDGFSKNESKFLNSYIVIQDTLWRFNNENQITIDSNAISIKDLIVESAIESLRINGKISNDPTDALNVTFDEMSLNYIENIVPASAIQFDGDISGFINLKDLYHKPIITAEIDLKALKINNNLIGDGALSSSYSIDNDEIVANGYIGVAANPMLRFKGSYFPKKEINNVIIKAKFNDTPLNIFEQYVVDYISEIEGTFQGDVEIKGDIELPELEGKLMLNNSKFKVDYLNTYYTVNDEIIIESDFFGFNLIKIIDEKGNSAIATGTAFHDQYENFSLDIGLEMKNFLALNTTAADNDMYYGKANISGLANISGYANNLIFDLNVNTEKNTKLNIPLSGESEVYSSNFLTFVEKDRVYKVNSNYEVDLDGITMNFDLSVTPDAEVRLIFDEQIGDVIKGRGSGNLKMQITTLGDFEMFGQYIIDEGDYLFTLQNLINKKFVLQKGGVISWNGDPFEADMDLSAIYKLRASLYDILPDDSTGNYRKRVPVSLKLNMEGKLMNPDIDFDIKLPTADDATQQRLNSILYVNSAEVNKQEMNKQVFSLLILNRFAAPSGLGQDYQHANVGATSSSEFLSNQLSNWLSRLSDDVNIGVNYRPGDELSSDEYELALSTQIFNDRVLLDGNVGYSANNYEYANNQSSSGLIGEFSVEYKISQDGRFRVRGFNRSNSNSLLQLNSPYTQGVGLFYREEFDTVDELLEKYKRLIFGSSSKDE